MSESTRDTKATTFTKSSASVRSSAAPGARPAREAVRESVIKEEEYSYGGSKSGYGGKGYDSRGHLSFDRHEDEEEFFDTGTIGSVGRLAERAASRRRKRGSYRSLPRGGGGSDGGSAGGGGRAAPLGRSLNRTEDEYIARARRKAAQDNANANASSVASSHSQRRSSVGHGHHRYPPRRGRSPAARLRDDGGSSLRSSASSGGRRHSRPRRDSNSSGGGLPRYAHHSLAGAGEVCRGGPTAGGAADCCDELSSRRSRGTGSRGSRGTSRRSSTLSSGGGPRSPAEAAHHESQEDFARPEVISFSSDRDLAD